MIIAVTGAYGFIGSNLIHELNRRGFKDILAVDNLQNSKKFKNLIGAEILEFIDKEDFINEIGAGYFDNQIDYLIHQGACSDTTLQDGKYMMFNNYEYSNKLLEYAQKNEIPFLYASSAATYGSSNIFIEDIQNEKPLNIYGYSKYLFDQSVRRYFQTGITAAIVGLRYFNVYGYREFHKNKMASVVLHNYQEYLENKKVKLFAGCKGYENGEQMRDFISIEDVVKVNMFFFENHLHATEEVSGIFNCGSGKAQSFNSLSLSVINACRQVDNLTPLTLKDAIAQGIIEYVPFPQTLLEQYQCFTEANLSALYESGYTQEFLSLEQGVSNYINQIVSNK